MKLNIGKGKLQGSKIFIMVLISTSFVSCQEMKERQHDLKMGSTTENCKILPDSDTSELNFELINCLNELELVILTKDFDRLLNLLDPKVTVSYGEAIYGKDGFIQYWADSVNQNELWDVLNRVFVLGGDIDEYRSQEAYVLPYTQIDRFYEGVDADWFYLATIISPSTYLYDTTLRQPLDTLDYDIVEILDRSTPNFTKVKTICGKKEGWVLNEKMYTCVDYTLILTMDDKKKWKIKVFSTE